MLLSNNQLKQKLRATKAELISALEAQNHSSGAPDSNIQTDSRGNLFNSATKKPNLSKRAKRREKTLSNAQEIAEIVKCGEKGGNEEGDEKKKRKRDENKEKEKVEQLKKIKKTKKAKEKVENGGVE